MLPYVYYRKAADKYPNSTHVGDNFSTPKNGSCAAGAKVGEGGCTWKHQAAVRMIYYPNLMAAGWNASLARDTPTDDSGSRHNIAAMDTAWDNLGSLVSPRCCGC